MTFCGRDNCTINLDNDPNAGEFLHRFETKTNGIFFTRKKGNILHQKKDNSSPKMKILKIDRTNKTQASNPFHLKR